MVEEFYKRNDCSYAVLKEDRSRLFSRIPTLYDVKSINEKEGVVDVEARGGTSTNYRIEDVTLFDSVESAVEYCITERHNRMDIARGFIEQRPDLGKDLIRIIDDEIRGLE